MKKTIPVLLVVNILILLLISRAQVSAQILIPGDSNGDGIVDGLDYVQWLKNNGTQQNGNYNGDFDGNGIVDEQDLLNWDLNRSDKHIKVQGAESNKRILLATRQRRPTKTLTPTRTKTPTRTPTITPSATMTPSPLPTWTPTVTPSDTPIPTETPIPTPTEIPTPTFTQTPSPTAMPGTLVTYPAYGGLTYQSPDYSVTIQQGTGTEVSSFAALSYQRSSYPIYDENGVLIQNFTPIFKNNTVRHTSTVFSFEGAPVTLRVKVLSGTPHISLPLTSCKILPSSYSIPCYVENGDTMVFSLLTPQKVFAIPNYEAVMSYYQALGQGHSPINDWQQYSTLKTDPSYHDVNVTQLTEGFKNPFIVLAHPLELETDIPDQSGALIVYPWQTVTQQDISNATVIWFTPGVHDYSNIGTGPGNQIILKRGQTVYIEGGAYVMARFKRSTEGAGLTRILGRGVISGINHKWVKKARDISAILLDIDLIKGVTITDRAAYGIERLAGTPRTDMMTISDIAMIGAWHGNTDSIEGEFALMENSLLIAFDDNLKLKEKFTARDLVVWQGVNAHPIMVHENTNRDLYDTIVENVDVVIYAKAPPAGQNTWELISAGALASVRGGYSTISNFTFKDIRIESPFLFRVIDLYNLDTNVVNPGWFSATTEANHSRINGMLFQNISVNTPITSFESLIGSAYDNSLMNVTFQNLRVNGTLVTETNKENFFEFEGFLDGVYFIP